MFNDERLGLPTPPLTPTQMPPLVSSLVNGLSSSGSLLSSGNPATSCKSRIKFDFAKLAESATTPDDLMDSTSGRRWFGLKTQQESASTPSFMSIPTPSLKYTDNPIVASLLTATNPSLVDALQQSLSASSVAYR